MRKEERNFVNANKNYLDIFVIEVVFQFQVIVQMVKDIAKRVEFWEKQFKNCTTQVFHNFPRSHRISTSIIFKTKTVNNIIPEFLIAQVASIAKLSNVNKMIFPQLPNRIAQVDNTWVSKHVC